jgi:hypothetical protein
MIARAGGDQGPWTSENFSPGKRKGREQQDIPGCLVGNGRWSGAAESLGLWEEGLERELRLDGQKPGKLDLGIGTFSIDLKIVY